MNIQSLNSSAFAAASAQRPQNAAPEASGSIAKGTEAAAPPQEAAAQGSSTSREQLNLAVQATKDFVNTVNSSLEFSVDEDTGTFVVKIVDKATKELIRQIPSQEMLSIAQALDTIKGLLFCSKA